MTRSMRRQFFSFAAMASCFLQFTAVVALAGGGPENVLVVINKNDPSSILIANHYIALRQIPASNVMYLDDVPDSVVTDYKTFRNKILEPIIKHINDDKLASQIDCVIYSTGFPTAVNVPEHTQAIQTRVKAEGGPEVNDMLKVLRGPAAITAMTYYALQVLADQEVYLTLEANHYYRRDAKDLLTRPFVGEQNEKYLQAVKDIDVGVASGAITTLEAMSKENPGQVAVNYQLARAYAVNNDSKLASDWLMRAIKTGWVYRAETAKDKAFAKVKDDPLFQGLASRIPDVPFEFAPTMGFSSRFSWGPNGGVNGSPSQGVNYLLCTMLGTTTEFGNSEEEIISYLSRSVNADGTQPTGTFVFTLTGDVRTTTRKPNFDFAIRELQSMGEKCEIVKGALPTGGRIVGAMLGVAGFKWDDSKSQIMPGAIVENLTSFGALFERAGQTKLSEVLRYGAAGSSGTVTEPYALQQKFPHPMIHVHYRRGCSLAEAFYLSISGPFQTLIVGDALCRPWAAEAEVITTGIDPNQTLKGGVNLDVAVKSPTLHFDAMELYLDGRLTVRKPLTESVSFDSTKISDGFHEMRVVVVSSDLIQNRYRKILPFNVDNSGQHVELKVDAEKIDVKKAITCNVNSNFGVRVGVQSNGRVLKEQKERTSELRIAASELGRGPVTIQAFAVDETGKKILSLPVTIEITGPIATKTEPLAKADAKKKK